MSRGNHIADSWLLRYSLADILLDEWKRVNIMEDNQEQEPDFPQIPSALISEAKRTLRRKVPYKCIFDIFQGYLHDTDNQVPRYVVVIASNSIISPIAVFFLNSPSPSSHILYSPSLEVPFLCLEESLRHVIGCE